MGTTPSPAEPKVLAELREKEPGGWEFSPAVAADFESMLARSVPGHAEMRRLTLSLARRFVREGTDVVDLGASRGEAVAGLVDAYGASVRWTLVERSPAMLTSLRQRFAGWADSGRMRVLDLDLRSDYPAVGGASLTLAILTLQFVPLERRQAVLERAYERTVPGGAILVVEKVVAESSRIDEVLVDEHRRLKLAAGYTEEEVRLKAVAIEGILVPLAARENERRLRSAGFRGVECYWRSLNFAGWVAIRPR